MAKVFRPSTRESTIISKIESSKERARRQAIFNVRDSIEAISNSVAMKLVENSLVETTSKQSVEAQINAALDKLARMDDFDVDYMVAPFRNVVPHPHIVSLYLTAFVIEDLIRHKDVVDIFGSDEDIYFCINKEVSRYIPTS